MNLLDNRNITCVEYYLLNKLNPIIDIRKLYYKSYVSAYKIYLDLLDSNVTFYNYEGIKRIQNILIENKMLTYKVTNVINEVDFKNKSLVKNCKFCHFSVKHKKRLLSRFVIANLYFEFGFCKYFLRFFNNLSTILITKRIYAENMQKRGES